MILLLTLLLGTLSYVNAACEDIPTLFLPYGLAAGDIEILDADRDDPVHYPDWPFLGFGVSGPSTYVTLTRGWPLSLAYDVSGRFDGVSVEPAYGPALDPLQEGRFFMRHSTSCEDRNAVLDVLCEEFDGVLVVTYECVTIGSTWRLPQNATYQILVAHNPTSTIVIILYGDPVANIAYTRVLDDFHSRVYDLDAADVADDSMIIMDVTNEVPAGTTPFPTIPASPCLFLDSCTDALAAMVECDDSPTQLNTCSKTVGVGTVGLEFTCLNDLSQTEVIQCEELCCCEKRHPLVIGGAGAGEGRTGPYCTRSDVLNWGFGLGSEAGKAAFCTGYGRTEGQDVLCV